ncbi:hypothetical protein NKJ36_33275 [Mesorhizobium sp. M0142]|uniref:hypothetical protein n=1 Tax=Mesorhizobium sp. M0142 TaxID=2956894 RepID=UPI00333826CD
MPLRLVIDEASSEEVARGIAAAEAVFEQSGISFEDAMNGMLAMELWDMKGFPKNAEPSECAFRKSRTGVPLIPGQWFR